VTVAEKKSKKTFKQQVMSVLRKENKALEVENRSLLTQVAKLENLQLKQEQRTAIAEAVREILFDAVRVLAKEVSNETMKGRRARELARKLLETHGVTPPGTLGRSRAPRKKTKKKKKRRKP
jgi:hypothetical protein